MRAFARAFFYLGTRVKPEYDMEKKHTTLSRSSAGLGWGSGKNAPVGCGRRRTLKLFEWGGVLW